MNPLKTPLDRPYSVYLHVPFCVGKCPYCAFASHVALQGEREAFPDLIGKELDLLCSRQGRRVAVDTLYIGGGTPTCLGPSAWEKLLAVLDRYLEYLPGREISVEANPDSLSRDHLVLWREWGVSRVSLGVQSLDDDELRWLGRPHDARKAMDAISAVMASGMELSVDLMFGLAGQTLRSWHRNLRTVLDTGLGHVSLYQLTLEEGSRWGKGAPGPLADGYPLYRWAQWYLPRRGYDQYEIASFARDRKWARHNLAYWYGADVLALGPGAWGFLDGTRYWNHEDFEFYRKRIAERQQPVAGSEKLGTGKAFREAAVIALRTRWGIPLRAFRRRYGLEALQEILECLQPFPPHFFRRTASHLALSPRGMRVANLIWESLL